MPSLTQVAMASALLISLGVAAPVSPTLGSLVNPASGGKIHTSTKDAVSSKDKSFSIKQVHNPKFEKNGAAAYAHALNKHKAPATKVQSVMAAASAAAAAASSGSVTATPQQYDSEYLCPVTIGSQDFTLDFDTGSSDLWVLGSSLSSSGGHTYYSPGASASEENGETWSISYGDGSSASGSVYSDTVTVGGTTVVSQAVEAATTASSAFTSGAEDGLVGLAFDSINTASPNQVLTFFSNAINQGLPSALFTANLLPGAPGSYDFGFIDTSLYSGDITYTDVDSSGGFWAFTPDSITIGSGSSQSGDAGIADTGTTLMLLGDDTVSAYYAQVQGSQNSQEQGGYIFPCSATLPDFTVTISGYDAVVPGSLINFAPVDGTNCFGGIQSDSGVGQAIYGDIFLKSQFVVFDRTQDTPRLGFAAKA